MRTLLSGIAIGALFISSAMADVTTLETSLPRVEPDFCINVMAGFPNDDHISRYQFFKLTQDLAADSSPMFLSALDFYGTSNVGPETPVMDVIENIANPVLRQAAPDLTVANMAFLLDFAGQCAPFLDGQVASLRAFDSELTHAEFNAVISEDALFMRQILSDSLFRLGAQEHEIFGPTVSAYAEALVTTRDAIEFTKFESDIEDLEALYMTDLDGRLARSNDVINEEMDRETLGASLEVVQDMNETAKRKRKEEALRTLSQILNRRY